MITIGLIINPYAGIGGAVGLKGSDGESIVKEALERGATRKAQDRMQQALEVLIPYAEKIKFITVAGEMGGWLLEKLPFLYDLLDTDIPLEHTNASHTQRAAEQMLTANLDVLLFAGGDGTARDIYAVIGDAVPVLGVPAGVKIHSAVYGITPTASGEVLKALVEGQMVDIREAEVRDLDEEAFRQNQVRAKHYGEMRVPQIGHFVQGVKQGGVESEELVLADIAAWVIESLEPDTLYLMGSGKTVAAIMTDLYLDNTLLGVDAVYNGELIGQDLAAAQILELLDNYPQAKAILSVMGGQGHIIGRGNQQISAEVLRKLGKKNVWLVSAKTKIADLEGRPLIIDSGDPELDKQWHGTVEVTTGYRDQIVHALS